MNNISEKKERSLTAVIVIALSAVFISLIWNNNVWMDEAFTASLVHTDFAGVIRQSMEDTLPPLYNILLKSMTTVFGYTTPVMKMTSVIPMILTLLLSSTVVRKRFGFRTAVMFMLCIVFMPLMLYFGVEIRMYSLGFFFATAAGVYAYEVVCDQSKKNIVLFSVFSALAGYSHHFAFITVAFAYLYLMLYWFFADRKKIRVWFNCLLITFVLYLPCLIVTLNQFSRVSGYFSMPDVDLPLFLQYVIYPYTTGMTAISALCLLVMLTGIVLFTVDLVRSKNPDPKSIYAIFCFGSYYGVLIFGTVISKIMSANVFVDRYLFFATGLLWLFVAIVLPHRKKIGVLAVAAIIVTGVYTYSVQYHMEYDNSANEEIAFLRENIGAGDILYCMGGHEELENCIPFFTYLDKDTNDLTFVYPLDEAIRTSVQNGTTLWIAVLDGFTPSEEDMQILSENGLSMEHAADFDFDRYKCEMYKVTR